MRRFVLLAALVAAACVKAVPPPPGPKPPPRPVFKIPSGCEADLSGPWRHLDDPTYAYAATDDGGTLALDAWRDFGPPAPDAGEAPPPQATARIVLVRSADGFAGTATGDVLHPTGRICSAAYPAEVVSCSDGGLVVRAAAAVSLGDGCQTPLHPSSPVMLVHRLARADGGLLRSGTTP